MRNDDEDAQQTRSGNAKVALDSGNAGISPNQCVSIQDPGVA